VLDHVYRAAAWQRVDQIRYSIMELEFAWKIPKIPSFTEKAGSELPELFTT
jgi:hypothetical protein